MTIRVVVADECPLFRSGFYYESIEHERIEVVGEAADGNEAVRVCEDTRPDVLVLDINLPGLSILQILDRLQKECPSVRVLVIGARFDQDAVHQLMGIGVTGYALRIEAIQSLLTAVEAVCRGATWFSKPIAHEALSLRKRGTELSFTGRERQVLGFIAQGWSNTQIADELHLSQQTVRNYVSRIYNKIGVVYRGQAIIWARERGFDSIDIQATAT